jgi:hypothetical protein
MHPKCVVLIEAFTKKKHKRVGVQNYQLETLP